MIFKEIMDEIAILSKKSALGAGKVTLLAASKEQSVQSIEAAIEAGITHFGENRVQEAQAKWPALKQRYPDLSLHLIGPLQTNKAAAALALFDVIQTLDRPKLAEAMAKELRNWGNEEWKKKNTPVPQSFSSSIPQFLIQVNTGEEPQKSGVLPQDADAFIRYCRDDLKLPVVGLMCIPPADQPPAPHFALLRKISLENDLHELSMGMSGDYAEAIRMGSTCVRLGRKLFGERLLSS